MSFEMPIGAFEAFLESQALQADKDSAHDISHVRRVVTTATRLGEIEGAEPLVVVPAAWLHDCVTVSKASLDRCKASAMAADAADEFLRSIEYPPLYLADIYHAIEAHSFARGLMPQTLEAKVVQDADHLDAIGAIGIARCFAMAGTLGRPLYCETDPFCQERTPDDQRWTVDHFYRKLLTLQETMHTDAGRREARQRTAYMLAFLQRLSEELGQSPLE